MVYDWDDKREACYRMYVVQKLRLDEVMRFFKDEVGFVPRYARLCLHFYMVLRDPQTKNWKIPWKYAYSDCSSKRAFQTQFRNNIFQRWGFPSKQNPAHRNEALVARTRELWERNTTQREMVGILQTEGFNITERELMRLRAKHRLLLRGPNRAKVESVDQNNALDPNLADEDVTHFQPYESLLPVTAIAQEGDIASERELSFNTGASLKCTEHPSDPLQDGEVKAPSKKRRRRNNNWTGTQGELSEQQRFPSETTLESSKVCLGLDNTTHLEVRNIFQSICQEQGIVKKTVVGPERWQGAKNELLLRQRSLSQAFEQAEAPLLDQMRLSLDVICMDVTKRLRNLEHKMTLAEAKNMLNINPEEGRRLRKELIDLLTAHNFVNKYQSDNWEELRQEWLAKTGLAERIPAVGSADRAQCLRAVQAVCRDIMKRWRDAQVSKGNGKSPENSRPNTGKRLRTEATVQQTGSEEQADAVPFVTNELEDSCNFQIDPELLLAAKGLQPDPYGQATTSGQVGEATLRGGMHAPVYL